MVLDILNADPIPDNETKGLKETKIDYAEIEFNDVDFSYEDEKGIIDPKKPKVLDKLSFKINPGERVAIVGEQGCGKSTIIKLMYRMTNDP